MAADFWNAAVYSVFIGARTRPAQDLLSAISPSFNPVCVFDLGCGPGNSTQLLKDRWPDADITGVDSSAEMITAAKSACPGIEFMQQDIAAFSPAGKVGLIFSNAALQWTADHAQLFPRLISFLEVDGVFAVQIPNNFHYPSHQAARTIAAENPRWQPFTAALIFPQLTAPLYDAGYYQLLLKTSGLSAVSVWETEYFTEMPDHRSIFNWVSGTGFAPLLHRMTAADREVFAEKYVSIIAGAYPRRPDGSVLFPFKRLFMMGVRRGD